MFLPWFCLARPLAMIAHPEHTKQYMNCWVLQEWDPHFSEVLSVRRGVVCQ